MEFRLIGYSWPPSAGISVVHSFPGLTVPLCCRHFCCQGQFLPLPVAMELNYNSLWKTHIPIPVPLHWACSPGSTLWCGRQDGYHFFHKVSKLLKWLEWFPCLKILPWAKHLSNRLIDPPLLDTTTLLPHPFSPLGSPANSLLFPRTIVPCAHLTVSLPNMFQGKGGLSLNPWILLIVQININTMSMIFWELEIKSSLIRGL